MNWLGLTNLEGKKRLFTRSRIFIINAMCTMYVSEQQTPVSFHLNYSFLFSTFIHEIGMICRLNSFSNWNLDHGTLGIFDEFKYTIHTSSIHWNVTLWKKRQIQFNSIQMCRIWCVFCYYQYLSDTNQPPNGLKNEEEEEMKKIKPFDNNLLLEYI